MMHQLKYKGNQEVGTVVGEWFAAELQQVPILQSVDYIIPVPLHKDDFGSAAIIR